jgi:hypothetical protein
MNMSIGSVQILSLLVATAFALAQPNPSRADLVLNLVGDSSWDRVQIPSGPSPFLFIVTSDLSAPAANQLNAFNVGVRIVPTAGAVGTISFQSVSVPPSNSIFTNFAAPPSIVPVLDFHAINGENAAFANVAIPNTGRSLFQAQIYSPNNNALGKFDFYADRETTNYFTTTDFDGLKFKNVQLGGDVNGAYLGSLTITAVPEPSSLVCAIILGGAMFGFRRFLGRARFTESV